MPSGQAPPGGALSDAGDSTRVATCSRALALKNDQLASCRARRLQSRFCPLRGSPHSPQWGIMDGHSYSRLRMLRSWYLPSGSSSVLSAPSPD